MTDTLVNIAAYALQMGALVLVALVMTGALRVRIPTHLLRFWQAVMAMALLLPLAPLLIAVDSASSPLFFSGRLADLNIPRDTLAARLPANWTPVVVAMITIGIAARLLWLAIGMMRVRKLVAGARRESAFDALLAELQGSLGVRATLMVSDSLEGPATVGVRRPVVLVPQTVVAMNTGVQRAILAHELLHVRRRDWLTTIGEEVWCAVLWFHPLARVVASRLSLAREMVVDEQTILLTRDRRAYAEALLAFSNPQPHVIGVTPFIGRRTLSQRIASIAQEDSMSHRRAVASLTIALVACVAVAAATAERFPISTTGEAAAQGQVYEPGPGITLPQVVHEVKPGYTRAAMEAKIQGSVWLGVVINQAGDVTNVTVNRSLDDELGLDAKAVEAAYKWKFRPASRDGQAVSVRVTVEMTFTLK